MSNIKSIGNIGNYYGDLSVKKEDGKFYWSIEDWNGYSWEEITKDLFDSLNNFNDDL